MSSRGSRVLGVIFEYSCGVYVLSGTTRVAIPHPVAFPSRTRTRPLEGDVSDPLWAAAADGARGGRTRGSGGRRGAERGSLPRGLHAWSGRHGPGAWAEARATDDRLVPPEPELSPRAQVFLARREPTMEPVAIKVSPSTCGGRIVRVPQQCGCGVLWQGPGKRTSTTSSKPAHCWTFAAGAGVGRSLRNLEARGARNRPRV